MRFLRQSLLPVLLFAAVCAHAKTTPFEHWVGTWATADLDRPNVGQNGAPGTFGTEDTTLRQIVHVSLGGSSFRVELSNEFGTEPLMIGAAQVALPGKDSEIQPATAHPLTFGGAAAVTIPTGASMVSDPVALTLAPLSDLAISIFLPAQKISHLTVHNSAYQINYSASGNRISAPALGTEAAAAKKLPSWFFLKAVDVLSPEADGAVVAFGDSITDGTATTANANRRWPDFLARRLQADKKTANLGVLNVGIGGNRVLHDNTGPNALARFDRDVLGRSGVKYLVILESINDIGHAYDPKKPYDVVTADELIVGLKQMIDRAHMHGIKVFGATLTPFMGAGYSSPEGEKVREAVNAFIRSGKAFDGVIDFESATKDPANPTMFLPAFNGDPTRAPDHLHPNDAGMEAMGNAIDLKLFTEK